MPVGRLIPAEPQPPARLSPTGAKNEVQGTCRGSTVNSAKQTADGAAADDQVRLALIKPTLPPEIMRAIQDQALDESPYLGMGPMAQAFAYPGGLFGEARKWLSTLKGNPSPVHGLTLDERLALLRLCEVGAVVLTVVVRTVVSGKPKAAVVNASGAVNLLNNEILAGRLSGLGEAWKKLESTPEGWSRVFDELQTRRPTVAHAEINHKRTAELRATERARAAHPEGPGALAGAKADQADDTGAEVDAKGRAAGSALSRGIIALLGKKAPLQANEIRLQLPKKYARAEKTIKNELQKLRTTGVIGNERGSGYYLLRK